MKFLLAAVLVVVLVTTFAWHVYRKRHPINRVIGDRGASSVGDNQKIGNRQRGPVSIDITGPLKNRGIVRRVLPVYPEWAEEQGIQGIVVLEVSVKPNGEVVSHMPVLQTAHPGLDELCLEAMLKWRFADIANGVGNQTGQITFRFQLS